MSERVFRPQGLGFVMHLPAYRTTFVVDRLRRSSGELAGDVLIRTEWPGARVVVDVEDTPGILHYGRMNLTSVQTRRAVGKAISERVPSPDDEKLDWPGLLDEFCIRVMLADRAGVDIEDVGNRPDSIAPKWAFEPFVPHGSYGILYGPGGLGKSAMAVALGISVQTGAEIIPGLSPGVTGPVLYLDWETTADDVDGRVKLVCKGAGIEPVALKYRRGAGRTLADQVEAIARHADKIDAVFLIVDSATLAVGTSGEGPIEDAANRFKSALDAIGRSALVIDHIPKPKPGERRPRGAGPIGSVMKSNWARASWEMREARIEEADEGIAHLALFHEKKNTTHRRRPIGLAMHWTSEGITWKREDITDESLTEGLTVHERLQKLLHSHPLTTKELATELDVTEAHVRTEIKRHAKSYVDLGVRGWGLAAGER